ncbi:MAG TPA: LysM peptidoglycan-binding domain-containing protein [Chlamydiales bacterium]|jgi:LysM repeat protein
MKNKILSLGLLILGACSPLKTSQHDEKHQLELTLHEVQINLDDLRHQINCFQSELQILDGRIKYNENALASLKGQDFEKQQLKVEALSAQVQAFEKKWSSLEKNRSLTMEEMSSLTLHAKETSAALNQFKQRIEELEKEQASGERRFEELGKLKGNLEILSKSLHTSENPKMYKVRPGDSLEKIAKNHQISVDKLKKLNALQQDKIVAGQELKVSE